jgi:type I restriction enzyme M protein
MPQDTFVSAKAFVKTSLLFMKKYTEEESKKWHGLLEEKQNEILVKQKNEREVLEEILKNREAIKEKKKEVKAKLKELNDFARSESRRLARADFDYPIFMCEAEHVGITSTGETGPETPNELPQILEEYKKFQKDPQAYAASKK